MNDVYLPILVVIISVLTSWIVSLSLKHMDYKNDYRKMIINKRIKAYEELEKIFFEFNIVKTHKKKKYLKIFTDADSAFKFNKLIARTLASQKLWIDTKTYILCGNLLDLCKIENGKSSLKHGIKNFTKIDKLGSKLEFSIISDLKTLHDTDKYLENKGNNLKS